MKINSVAANCVRHNKQNKGITLIALVITIIVMLILVAVTITIAVNGGLFNYAQEAGVKTNEAKDKEQNYVDLAEGLTYEDLIGRYSAELNPKGTIPEGGKYTVASTGDELEGGSQFPTTVSTGDMYEYGDYAYKYNQFCDEGDWDGFWETDEGQNGWGVRVKNLSKNKYGSILYSINGKTVNTLYCTFFECNNLAIAPTIPNTITNLHETFWCCYPLHGIIVINSNPSDFWGCFSGCAQNPEHTITLTGSSNKLAEIVAAENNENIKLATNN